MSKKGEDYVYDAAVVGAGMAGMATAEALSAGGMSVCLIECHDLNSKIVLPERYDIRVCALTEASWNFLKRLDVWSHTDLSRICSYERMRVWDARGIGQIQFTANDTGYPQLGRIVENQVILTGLLGRLRERNAVIMENTAVREIDNRPDQVCAHLDNGKVIKTRVLIAADGANSMVRKLADIPLTYSDCLHQALICNIKTSRSHQHCAWQVFTEGGPLAFLPLPYTFDEQGKIEHNVSVVWSLRPDEAKKMMTLGSERFCQALTATSEMCAGKVLRVSEIKRIPLAQRHANNYVKGRIALVGDAAHTVHPLAGQGANLGFFDTAVLAEELLMAFQAGDDAGADVVLKRYVKRRRKHNTMMLGAMNGFQHLFDNKTMALGWLRNIGMSLLDKHMPIKRRIIQEAMGITGDLPSMMRKGI